MKRLLSIAALTTLSVAALLPLSASAQTRTYITVDSPAPVRVQHRYYEESDRYNRYAPPPPRRERIPHAKRGYVWQPGHWVWQGNRHAWMDGQWLRARQGYVYLPTAWVERDGRYHYRESRWERSAYLRRDRDHDGMDDRRERRDMDRDGIRDGRDRDLDNDGISNRRDRDVDGDGVRNDRDRVPDNRYRY